MGAGEEGGNYATADDITAATTFSVALGSGRIRPGPGEHGRKGVRPWS